jgi:hypothetical protein
MSDTAYPRGSRGPRVRIVIDLDSYPDDPPVKDVEEVGLTVLGFMSQDPRLKPLRPKLIGPPWQISGGGPRWGSATIPDTSAEPCRSCGVAMGVCLGIPLGAHCCNDCDHTPPSAELGDARELCVNPEHYMGGGGRHRHDANPEECIFGPSPQVVEAKVDPESVTGAPGENWQVEHGEYGGTGGEQ